MYLTQFLPQFKFCIISIQGLLYNLWVLVQNEDAGPQLGWESQCPLPTGLPLQSIMDWWLKGIATFSLEWLTTWMRVGERSLLKHLLIVECFCQPRCGTATALPAPCSTCSIPPTLHLYLDPQWEKRAVVEQGPPCNGHPRWKVAAVI